jgi:hypothetical protein
MRFVMLSLEMPLLDEWREWLTQHGLVPDDIPNGSVLLCDDETRTVQVEVYVRDENGYLVSDGREGVLSDLRTVQLEAPALSFPGES